MTTESSSGPGAHMADNLTAGYDVAAHLSRSALERIFQSYYLAGAIPSRIAGPFSHGGTTQTAEVFLGEPELFLVSAGGIPNPVRLRFRYVARVSTRDDETTGQVSVVAATEPLLIPGPDGKPLTGLGVRISGPGLGPFTFSPPGDYPEFESGVRPLVQAGLFGGLSSLFLTPAAEVARPELVFFRIYPGAAGFAAVFVKAALPVPPLPATQESLLRPGQDLAVALPGDQVDQLFAEGLASMGLGELPATLEIDGEGRTVESLSLRRRNHYLEITGEIDNVEFEAKALVYATGGGFQVEIKTLDVDLPWYADVVNFLSGGAIERALSQAFPKVLGSIGTGATGGLGLFSSRLPDTGGGPLTTGVEMKISDSGVAWISVDGMTVGAIVTPTVANPAPIAKPTYVKGNPKSKEFHRYGCPYGDKMKSWVPYIHVAAAIRAGYNGCFTCANEHSHPLGRLEFGIRSEGNQPNALTIVELTLNGKLLEPVVVDGVQVTDPPFSETVKLTVKVKPDGTWQRTVQASKYLVIPGRWRLRARIGAWTGECVAQVRPTARNFGSRNLFAFTVGKPTGAFGYDLLPPFP